MTMHLENRLHDRLLKKESKDLKAKMKELEVRWREHNKS